MLWGRLIIGLLAATPLLVRATILETSEPPVVTVCVLATVLARGRIEVSALTDAPAATGGVVVAIGVCIGVCLGVRVRVAESSRCQRSNKDDEWGFHRATNTDSLSGKNVIEVEEQGGKRTGSSAAVVAANEFSILRKCLEVLRLLLFQREEEGMSYWKTIGALGGFI